MKPFLMVKKMKKVNKNLLFVLAFNIYTVLSVLMKSYYSILISDKMEDIIKIIVLTIIIIEIFAGKRVSAKNLFLMCIFACGSLSVYIGSDISEALVIAFILIGACSINIRPAIKQGVLVYVATSLVVVASSLIGVLPNDMFIRNVNSQRVVYAYGFYGYATIPYAVFMINILYMLITGKIDKKRFLVWIAVDIAVFIIFTNRLMLILEMLFYMISWWLKDKKINIKKVYRKIGLLFPWILAAVSVGASYFLDLSNPVMSFINQLLSWRLYYGKVGIERYPVGLFGQYVEMRGNLAVGRQSEMGYFYIDCGYIHSLLRYGLLFFLVILILYSIIGYYAALTNNKMLFCIVIVILIGNCINNLWLSLDTNPILLYSFPAIEGIRRYKMSFKKEKLALRCCEVASE